MGRWSKTCSIPGVLIVVLILCTSVSLGHPEDPRKVKLLVTVFRHGDRTPAIDIGESFPTDPNGNVSLYQDGLGHLTNAGKRRAFEYGQTLRERYDHFLGDRYMYNEVNARSTAIIRSKMSLQLVLAGMYPPAPSQKWNPDLNWQPMHMTHVPILQDGLLLPTFQKSYKEALNEVLATEEVQEKLQTFQPFMDDMAEKTGKRYKCPMELMLLYQTFVAQEAMNLTVPEWTKNIYPDGELKDVAVSMYQLQNYNDKTKRRNGGILLHQIIKDMQGVINGIAPASEKKVHLYSAQDINVAAVMSALNVYDNQPPAYSSAIMLELRENGGKYFVKLVHSPGVPQIMKELTIPGCATFCPFEDFLKLTSKVMPSADELSHVIPYDKPYM